MIFLTILIIVLATIIGVRAYRYYHIPRYDPITIEATDADDTTDGVKLAEPEEVIIEDEPIPLAGTEIENAIGWLKLGGTEIDDPILQCGDNDYYLRHDENGEYSVWGAYFMNCNNNASDAYELDRVTTIFGHSNGQATSPKFANLKLLRKPEYAKECRTIELWIGDIKTTWRIFAVGDYPIANDYLVPNPSDEYFDWEIGQMKAYSYNQYDVEVSSSDKILILSTCTGTDSMDTRYIVCAKLTEIG